MQEQRVIHVNQAYHSVGNEETRVNFSCLFKTYRLEFAFEVLEEVTWGLLESVQALLELKHFPRLRETSWHLYKNTLSSLLSFTHLIKPRRLVNVSVDKCSGVVNLFCREL